MKIILFTSILIILVLVCNTLGENLTQINDSIDDNSIEDDLNSPRIVGGKIALPNQFSYQVGLNILMDNKNLQVCGGALVSDIWILTAAHCLYKAKSAEVILGAHDISNAKEKTQKRIIVNAKNFIIHSDYPKIWTDIALLRLPNSVLFNFAIKPINLPCLKDKKRNYIGSNVLVSGWGMVSDGPNSLSSKLKYTNIKIVPSEVCTSFFGSKLAPKPAHIYCAKGLRGTSTCSGDSGGPLVSLNNEGKVDKLIGLVSFGMIGGCTKGHPQGFLKLSSYLDWISKKTNGSLKESKC